MPLVGKIKISTRSYYYREYLEAIIKREMLPI